MKVDRTDFEVWIYDSGYFMKSLNLKDKIFELVEKILNKEISIMDLKRFRYKFIVYKIAFAYCLHFKDKQIEKLIKKGGKKENGKNTKNKYRPECVSRNQSTQRSKRKLNTNL